jgi:hypothetical protein
MPNFVSLAIDEAGDILALRPSLTWKSSGLSKLRRNHSWNCPDEFPAKL